MLQLEASVIFLLHCKLVHSESKHESDEEQQEGLRVAWVKQADGQEPDMLSAW